MEFASESNGGTKREAAAVKTQPLQRSGAAAEEKL
jgi:hypothetical protein